ncbi:MAG: Ig-like domain-containing protein [Methanobacterium sp.]|nr:Ig-like domain-containing protein [Methanobacterium sp.]
MKDATGVLLTSPITITFNENITSGSNYSGIYIKNLTIGQVVSIASKTISGNILILKMTYSRLSKNNYMVYLPAGAVKDAAGNSITTAYSTV